MEWKWTAECQQAWDSIVTALVESRGVFAPDYKKAFYVRTDACARGLGAYLFQYHEEEVPRGSSTVTVRTERVIEYWSRSVPKAFRHYDTRKLELLAVILGLEHFKPMIDGVCVQLDTDHRNLTWLENVKHSTGQLARWAMRLSEFNYKLKYRPGNLMQVADCLSRNPLAQEVTDQEMEQIMHTVSIVEIEPALFELSFHTSGDEAVLQAADEEMARESKRGRMCGSTHISQ